MRHRLIPAALAAGASLTLLAGTAMAATPTWTVVPSVNPSATTLNAVFARTATDAWAVGQFPGAGDDAGSQIFAERWNGTQWQQTPTTNIVRQDERLLGVSASGPNDAWAVGNGFNNVHDTSATVANQPVIEHWNGTAWSIVTSPAGLISVDRISAASATDIWASGQAPLQTIGGVPVPVAKTLRWNGTAWSVMAGPTASDPSTAVTGLSALPSGEAWATGATFSTASATAFIAHHTP